MPVDGIEYCTYCTDENGQLQSFDERFARMVSWQEQRSPMTPRDRLESETLAYMATMPAWRDHPRVREAMPAARHA